MAAHRIRRSLILRTHRQKGARVWVATSLFTFCAAQFQLLSFVGEEAERVNASVFRAATGPTRDIVKKMATQ